METKKILQKLDELKLSSKNVELGVFDDILKYKSKFESAAKSANKSVLGSLSDLADSTSALENGIKLAEEGVIKARELGWDEGVKKGNSIISDFNITLKQHQKAISDLRGVRSLIS